MWETFKKKILGGIIVSKIKLRSLLAISSSALLLAACSGEDASDSSSEDTSTEVQVEKLQNQQTFQ